MKFKNHPLFLITILSLFFPLGIIFLILSELPGKRKVLFAAIGLTIFVLLVSLAFLNKPNAITFDDFQVYATRNELSLGQSGGLLIAAEDDTILTNYSIQTTKELKLSGTVYTAQKCGNAKITITANNKEKEVEILINDTAPVNETVFLSPTGKRYHKTKSHAGKNSIPMLEEEAIQSAKTPCLICYKK